MSMNELQNKVDELRELRRMADELAAEIAATEDELKAYMTANNADELHGPSFKITWKPITSSRLGRISRRAFFGNEEYSREELVAEIGAAALLNHCGIETGSSFKNSAAYIKSWLRVLRNDKKMIVSASGAAAKAFELITGTT